MKDWAEKYEDILTRSEVEVVLLAGYVDDGQKGIAELKPGMQDKKAGRWNNELKNGQTLPMPSGKELCK